MLPSSVGEKSLKRTACCNLEDSDCCGSSRRPRTAPLRQATQAATPERDISSRITEIEEFTGDVNVNGFRPALPTPEIASHTYKRPLRREDFQIAIICALPIEYDAVCLLIDQYWDEGDTGYGRAPGDNNHYRNGRLGEHNVVLMQLPGMGKSAAAGSTASLRSSYYNIRLSLLVGICGGVPQVGKRETLLGDVVIGESIFQYDFGRQYHSKHVPKAADEGNLGGLNKDIRGFIAYLKTEAGIQDVRKQAAIHLRFLQDKAIQNHSENKYRYPGCSQDKLFTAAYQHKHHEPLECSSCAGETDSFCREADKTNCEELGCDEDMLVPRQRLKRKQKLKSEEEQQRPEIFIGHIASGDTVMRSSEHRDTIANSRQEKIIAFEMEGAGAFDETPSLVIKGICDYADSHKNKEWQPFAAATAAAVAKAVLNRYTLPDIPAGATSRTEFDEQDYKCLADLRVTDPADDKTRITQTKGNLLKDSYIWILEHVDFKQWYRGNTQLLWITGDPGKGKTMLLCGLIDELSPSTKLDDQKADTFLSYFLFQGTDTRINNATAAIRGLIYMLIKQQAMVMLAMREEYKSSGKQLFEDTNAWFALSKILLKFLKDLKSANIYFIIDALDECTDRTKLMEFIIQSSDLSHVKWIVSSRNTPDIHRNLKSHTSYIRLSLELEDNTEYVSKAVDAYIKYSISDLSSVLDNDVEKAAVYAKMRKKANGTFLWVSLVMKELKKANYWEVQNILNEFPTDLWMVYRRMIDQIKQQRQETQELCSLMLSTLTLAYRPLHLEEIAILPRLPKGISSKPKAVRDLVNQCGLFFTIRGQYIYIIHQSAMDFLSDEGIGLLLPDRPDWRTETHRTILSQSLEALSTTLKRDIYNLQDPGFLIADFKIPDQDPLISVRYSCTSWIDHLREIKDCHQEDYLRDNGKIDIFLKTHLLHWLETLGLIGKIYEGARGIILLESMVKAADGYKFHDFLHDAKRFLLYAVWMIEEAPLQTYFSALTFAPQQSLVRKQFEGEISHHLDINPIQHEWNALLQVLRGHSSHICSVAFSPDGKTIASASLDGRVILWDSMTGMILNILESDWVPSYEVAFSPDGTKVASILVPHNNNNNYLLVRIHDTMTGIALEEARFYKIYDWLKSFSNMSPFGELSQLSDNLLRATDSKKYKSYFRKIIMRNITKSFVRHANATALVLHANATALVLHANATALVLHANATALVLSPNGKLLAYIDKWGEKLQLWDITADKYLVSRKIVPEEFQNNGIYGELGDRDLMPTRLLSFSPDGNLIALTLNNTARIFNVITSKFLEVKQSFCSSINTISFSPNRSILACALKDTTVMLWDIETGVLLQTLESQETVVGLIAFSPDSKMVATASSLTGSTQIWAEITVRLWDTTTGKFLRSFKGHSCQGNTLAFLSGGKTIGLASGRGIIQLWNVATGEVMPAIELHRKKNLDIDQRGISFSPDGKLIATSSRTKVLKLGFVRVWDRETGAILHTLECYGKPVNTIVFSPNGKTIGTAFTCKSSGVKIYLWDVATGALLHLLQIPSYSSNSMAISLDGRTIALASNDRITFSDIETGLVQGTYKIKEAQPRQIVYSSSENTIVCLFTKSGLDRYTHDVYVRIWDISAAAFLQTYGVNAQVSGLFDHDIYTALSSDGKKLSIVCSRSFSVRVYDATTGASLNTFSSYSSQSSSAVFSPNGNIVISASDDRTVQV